MLTAVDEHADVVDVDGTDHDLRNEGRARLGRDERDELREIGEHHERRDLHDHAVPWDEEAFVQRVLEQAPVTRSTVVQHLKTLRRMLGEVGADSPCVWLDRPHAIAAVILNKKSGGVRDDRYLAWEYFLRYGVGLAEDHVQHQLRPLRELLPVRMRLFRFMLDFELGGDKKLARLRATFTLLQAEHVVAYVRMHAAAPVRMRDVAMMALHFFTGLPSQSMPHLRWDDFAAVLSEYSGSEDVSKVHIDVPGARGEVFFHAHALNALRDLWLGSGRPVSGPVLVRAYSDHRPVTREYIGDVVHKHLVEAGLPHIDKRRLRGAFALFLLDRNESKYAVRRGFLFRHTYSLDQLVEPFREARAHAAAIEHPFVHDVHPVSDFVIDAPGLLLPG